MSENLNLDELKKFLEEKIQALKKEKEMLELLLSLIESGIIGSKTAQVRIEPKPGERVIPIRSSDGTLLAEMYVSKNEVRLVPLVPLSIDTPPFRQFFIARVLENIKKKDVERIEKGILDPSKAFDYEITVDRGIIKEIRLKNVYDEQRRIDIKSSAKWTFERMYEKTKKARK